MSAVELLRSQIAMTKEMTAGLLANMQDAPLTFPTPNGGNHPTWIAGHLAYAEANLIQHMLEGRDNPLLDWKGMFGAGTEPTDNADDYPPLGELLAKWDEVREYTMKFIDSLTDADLDKPALNFPAGREAFFGTFGKVLTMVAMHPLMHRGQAADARRAAGRERLMA